MVKECRIDVGLCKKGSSKKTWNKGKLRNRYRARWAKGKTGMGLDEHCANSQVYCVLCVVSVLRYLS